MPELQSTPRGETDLLNTLSQHFLIFLSRNNFKSFNRVVLSGLLHTFKSFVFARIPKIHDEIAWWHSSKYDPKSISTCQLNGDVISPDCGYLDTDHLLVTS